MPWRKERLRHHARTRANERYGMHLSNSEIKALEKRIRQGDCTKVEVLGHGQVMYDISHNGRVLRVIYLTDRRAIATFWPRDES